MGSASRHRTVTRNPQQGDLHHRLIAHLIRHLARKLHIGPHLRQIQFVKLIREPLNPVRERPHLRRQIGDIKRGPRLTPCPNPDASSRQQQDPRTGPKQAMLRNF